MPALGVITVQFDPAIQVGDLLFRWQTIGTTLALLVALAVAAARAWQVPAEAPVGGPDLVTGRPVRRRLVGAAYPPAPEVDPPEDRRRLRLDDLVFIVLAVVPGAVVGGRIVHAVTFWDAYAGQPERLLDPATGSLSLAGAVVGGVVSGAYICRLLGAPVREWADAAAVPALLALGLGKVAQFLGGSGQGEFLDLPWAVAFVGPGPWISAAADVPAHPSQLYEAAWLMLGVAVIARGRHVVRVAWAGRLALAVGWFLVGRVVVGFTWRDDRLLGPLNAEQLVAIGLLLIGLVAARPARGRT